ncbi:hypothetical protein [Angustibacter aerolatus]
MGTEVLDDGSGRPPASGPLPAHGAVEPVPFDTLEQPPPPPQARAASAVVGAVVRRLPPRRVLVALLVALRLGAVLGGYVGARSAHRQALRVQAAADASTLAVLAYATDVSVYRGSAGQTALLNVEVTNAGPLPVSVVGSDFGVNATRDRPLVRPSSEDGAVPPRTTGPVTVAMVVLVDCAFDGDRTVTLPVRTADDVVHQVRIEGSGRRIELASSCVDGRRPL